MTSQRNPDKTRQRILEAAFHEMHLHGFQGMRVDLILERTGLRKGALYHHFPSKLELGYAVLQEIIVEATREIWIRPLSEHNNPVEGLLRVVDGAMERLDSNDVRLGCPLNNLAQEMSPVDPGFKQRIEAIFEEWIEAIAESLRRGQRRGVVRHDINARGEACFIVASAEGCLGLSKTKGQPETIELCHQVIRRHIQTLEPTEAPMASVGT